MALITVAGHTMDDSKWDMYCIRHKDGTAEADEIICGMSWADLRLVTDANVNEKGWAHVSTLTTNELAEIRALDSKRRDYCDVCHSAVKGDAR